MTFKVKKRFIAGAVCPRCSEMDKLMTYKENEKEFRECVSCGFKDEMRFKQQNRELETRVNITDEMKTTETQVLILDPDGNKNKH
ncbi:MAG: YheV family putative zinc ribbon protein [Cellvibrionaceae bacterium]